MSLTENKYFTTLKSYMDRVVKNQITEIKDPHFYGAVLCPSCMHAHGRIADAVYPLVAMYRYTSEVKYLDCARRTVEWSENNLLRTSGEYFNDKVNSWIGTTVFTSISFGETLILHGEVLPEDFYSYIYKIYVRLTDFVKYKFIESGFDTNVNYFAAYASAMSIAYRLTGKGEYKDYAEEMLKRLFDRFVVDGIVVGEGMRTKSPKGLYGVDIGYNVEETLPALSACAHYLDDEELERTVMDMWRRHLEFMLPDGAWDNSFGSRHDKWTYYGSRTSDGAATGLCYIWDKDPIFAEAAERNLELMRICSKDGYLYGGRMYIEAGEEPCLHHSFTHAKSFAAMIDHGFVHKERVRLPREEEYGRKHIAASAVELISLGDFRATVSACDAFHHKGACTGGGCMTMLWHERVGAIFAATMAKYERAEPYNMQYTRRFESISCLSMRVECDGYSSVNAKDATFTVSEKEKCIFTTADGELQNEAFARSGIYSLSYEFSPESVKITAHSELGGDLVLPVICGADGVLEIDGAEATIKRGDALIKVKSDSEIVCESEKAFNLVGGFVASILKINIEEGQSVSAEISVV